jgi:hypothetical protein
MLSNTHQNAPIIVKYHDDGIAGYSKNPCVTCLEQGNREIYMRLKDYINLYSPNPDQTKRG